VLWADAEIGPSGAMIMTGRPSSGPTAPPPSALLIVEPVATIAQLLALAHGEQGHAEDNAPSPHEAL
jgi:hypothetical protein